VDTDTAFDILQDGIVFRNNDGEITFYLARGVGSPLGQQAPVPTIFVNELGDIWRKIGPLVTDWSLIDTGDLYIDGVGANYNHIAPQCVGGGDANGN